MLRAAQPQRSPMAADVLKTALIPARDYNFNLQHAKVSAKNVNYKLKTYRAGAQWLNQKLAA
jgi:hypothetical protein